MPQPAAVRKISWLAAAVGLALIALAASDWYQAMPPDALAKARFVGRSRCADCHQQEHDRWVGSHHDLAMDLATDESVLADFDDAQLTYQGVTSRFFRRDGKFLVHTEGPDGELRDYVVKYTFGVDPLQQYMVEMPDGRVQVLRTSWDTHRRQWFYLPPPDARDERIPPGDPLHWTGIAQNWNTTCAECHSTNLKKNYDLARDTYHTTFDEIDVSCEECHGPGSLHVELATARSLFWDRTHGYGLAHLKSKDTSIEIEACAKCHSRRSVVHGDFRPGQPLLDHYEPSLLSAGLYHDDGQILDEVYVYGSFLQSEMHAKGVRCTDCHDPHSLQLKFQGNRLCSQCHTPAKYDTPAHHRHAVDSPGSQCVECHMPATTYMEVDPRRDHSFRAPRPDLTVELGTPNACNNCHTKPEESAEWAARAVREWFGEKRFDDPHWAPAIHAGNRGLPEGEEQLVRVVRRREMPAIVRATALSLLDQYAGRASREAREKALTDGNSLVRLAAVRTVPADSPELLRERLGPRLRDPIRAVRAAAANRLAILPRTVFNSDERAALDAALAEYRAMQRESLERAASHINLANLDRSLAMAIRSPQLLEQAVESLQTAIRLEPYLTGPRAELASLLQDLGHDGDEVDRLRREELELAERDVELLPDSGPIWYRLGLLRHLTGDLAGAQQAMEKACELMPQAYDAHLALAMLAERRYEQTGGANHFETAVAALEKCDAINSQDPQHRLVLQRLLATRDTKQSSRETPPDTGLE